MPGPSPLNSACRCCLHPPTASIQIQYVSISQSCSTCSCGETPCTSTEAVYDEEGNCVAAAQECSPNWADLSAAEKCANKKYLTVTTTDTSGGGNNGRTQVRKYTTDDECGCELETTCSGSTTNTTSYSASQSEGTTYTCSLVETATTSYAGDCSSEVETTCSGASGYVHVSELYDDYTGMLISTRTITCQSQVNPDCTWNGTLEDNIDGDIVTYPINEPCPFACGDSETVTSPTPNCTITVTYSGVNEQGFCTPKQFPSFPAFTECTPEGEEPPEPPELEPGQGYGSEAYKYENPKNPQIKSEAKVKYRVEHTPTGTCYLKIWFRKRIQQWKYEDCETGFPGDPTWDGGTPPADVNCDEDGGNPCASRWSTDGEPTFQDDGNYEWRGTGYPCYEEDDKLPTACENQIYGAQIKNITAGQNQSVTLEFKYSFIEDYEPNWPDDNGSQGCKPNGFPIADPEDCPEYNP